MSERTLTAQTVWNKITKKRGPNQVSVVDRVVNKAPGIVRSAHAYLFYYAGLGPENHQRGKVRSKIARSHPKLRSAISFQLEHKSPEPEKGIDDVADVIQSIDTRLEKGGTVPHGFIHEGYQHWIEVKSRLQEVLGEQGRLTDYMLMVTDKKTREKTPYLFVTQENHLIPVKISNRTDESELFDLDSFHRQVRESLNNKLYKEESDDENQAGSDLDKQQNRISLESAIAKMNLTGKNQVGKLRLLIEGANSVEALRNKLFDSEEQMFFVLGLRGGYTLDEFKIPLRYLVTHGFAIADNGEVMIDQDLLEVAKRVYTLAMRGYDGESGKYKISPEADQHFLSLGRETMYYRLVGRYLDENPAMIDEFLTSEVYQKYALEFKLRFVPLVGQTERDTAKAMIANLYLMAFEGSRDFSKNSVSKSHSQRFLRKVEGLHQQLLTFVEDYQRKHQKEAVLGLPERSDSSGTLAEFQEGQIRNVLLALGYNPFFEFAVDPEKKKEMVDMSYKCIGDLESELARNPDNHLLMRYLRQKFGLLIHDSNRVGALAAVIGNLGLVRVPGEDIFTISSWLRYSHRIMPNGKYELHYKEQELHPTREEVVKSLRTIFSPESDASGGTAYARQLKRIEAAAPVILNFLKNSKDVPPAVGKFAAHIASPYRLISYLVKFIDENQKYPHAVNPNFPDSAGDFFEANALRWVIDLVYGTQSQLIQKTDRVGFQRYRVSRTWKDFDFSDQERYSDTLLTEAFQTAIAKGNHRLRLYLDETKEIKDVKTLLENVEMMFGNQTFSMEFTRYTNMAKQIKNLGFLMGLNFLCICYGRKSIFNPDVFWAW